MRACLVGILGLFALLTTGCFSPEKKTVFRSAIDQQLTASALQACVDRLDLQGVPRGPVYSVEVSSLTDADVDLLRAKIQTRLFDEGFQLARRDQQGQSVIEVVLHYAGTDVESTLLGIPLFLPGLPVGTGDISIYKSTTQTGRARLGLQVWGQSGILLTTCGEVQASRHLVNQSFLTFIGDFVRTNMEDFAEPGDESDED